MTTPFNRTRIVPLGVLLLVACGGSSDPAAPPGAGEASVDASSDVATTPEASTDGETADGAGETMGDARNDDDPALKPSLPLILVADVDLPGKPVRFDYQDLDPTKGYLVIAHMNDASVVIVNVNDGSVEKVLAGIPTARGVVVADDVGRIFVTSSPNKLVIIDNGSLAEISRVDTGSGPDGVGWDSVHKIVGVSDQGDGDYLVD